jgi:hypothetical protein
MHRRAFTKIELLVLVLVAAIGLSLLLPGMSCQRRRGHRPLSDVTQLRGIHQSLVTWAGNHRDKLPLPSELDLAGRTVDVGQVADPERAIALDSTRHIFSVLLWDGYVPFEQLVSPAEAGNIEVNARDFDWDKPRHAANPDLALWNPAFRATPEDSGYGATEGQPGGFSYAHLVPLGSRRDQWRNSFDGSLPVLANRGPSYTLNGPPDTGSWILLDPVDGYGDRDIFDYDTPVGVDSNTLLIHGGRDAWEGNVVHQDNSARFVTAPISPGATFRFAGLDGGRGRRLPDNLFVNEDESTRLPRPPFQGNEQEFGPDSGLNAYLRSYAGGPGQIRMGGEAGTRRWTVDVFHD